MSSERTSDSVDRAYLEEACVLARRGEGHTRPNPPVGALLVRRGVVLGRGYHRKAGERHAETAALADARRRGHTAHGATLYVTLEPCSRPGRVGACTDAIVAAGVSRVVYGAADPNPVNRGRARRILSKAGIACRCLPMESARRLIAPFAKHVKTGLPFVTVKLAMSLDGRIADAFGDARWISSAVSRRRTGRLRERVDAIMVGAETVRRDDPSLLSHGRRNDDLLRVVVSRSGRLPESAQVFADGRNPTLVFRDPKTALEELGRRGCLHVLCEGGLALARSLADAGLVDCWRLVTAPLVLGLRPIAAAQRFKLVENGLADRRCGDRDALYLRRK